MLIGILIIVLSLIFDQITKQLAVFYLFPDGVVKKVVAIPRLLELTYVENPGASFGFGEGLMWLFYVVTIVALGIFIYLFKDVDFKHKRVYSISVSLFIAGALGNFIDRILFGFVIDFMHFPFLVTIFGDLGNFTNNWADMFLSLAIVLFTIDIFFLEPKRLKKEKINDETDLS